MTVMILIMCSICLIVGVRATGGTSFPEPIQELHHTLSNPKQRQPEQKTSFEPRSFEQGERSSFGGFHQTSPSFSGREQEEPIPNFDYNLPYQNVHQSEHEMSPNPEITTSQFVISISKKPGNPIVKHQVHSQTSSQTSNEDENNWSFNFIINIPAVDSNEDLSGLEEAIDGLNRNIDTISDKVPEAKDLIENINKIRFGSKHYLLPPEEIERLHALKNPTKTSKTTKFLKYVLLPLSLLAGGFLIWYYIKNRQP